MSNKQVKALASAFMWCVVIPMILIVCTIVIAISVAKRNSTMCYIDSGCTKATYGNISDNKLVEVYSYNEGQ